MKNKNKLYKFLLYVTNNEEKPRDEEVWDMIFFLIEFFATIGGCIFFIIKNQPEWMPVIIIEFCWAFDQLRHNRA